MRDFINRHRKKIMISLLILGFLCIGGGIYLVVDYEAEMKTGYDRLEQEESLADNYIAYLLELKNQMAKESASSTEGSESTNPQEMSQTDPSVNASHEASLEPPTQQQSPVVSTEAPFEDNLWLYSPEYAKGTIECVLEVPCAKIRRGVYTGAIENDLNYWMVVAARDDYELGKTHYCIYGHNSTKHDLSFNNLQPNCKLGDTFTLTNIDGVYEYTITNLFSVSRTNATKKYVDNFKLSSDLCYIITCGRNEHRYKDFIVEGTLTKFTPLEELIQK